MDRLCAYRLGIVSAVTLVVLCCAMSGRASEISVENTLEEVRTTLAGDDVEAAWNAIGAVPSDLSGPEREETIALLRKTLMRQWPRCTGDIRQTISRKLSDLDARAAVPDLLELIRQDRRISHECAE